MKEADLRKAEKSLDKAEKIISKGDQANIETPKVWYKTKVEEEKSKELWKIENNIINPGKKLKAPIDVTGANNVPSIKKLKQKKDPYYGLSRKQRRHRQFKEEFEREQQEERKKKGEDNSGGGDDDNDGEIDSGKLFEKSQRAQKSSGKETKRIESLRRNYMAGGALTDQEKQRIDNKRSKKNKRMIVNKKEKKQRLSKK
ncbi:hypothetical protein ACTA71_008465 [Dictyostelium dimigraforme]